MPDSKVKSFENPRSNDQRIVKIMAATASIDKRINNNFTNKSDNTFHTALIKSFLQNKSLFQGYSFSKDKSNKVAIVINPRPPI